MLDKLKLISVFTFIVQFLSCSVTTPNCRCDYDYDFLDCLYWQADSIERKHDSLLVYNSILDTIHIETGIFSYLRSDFRINAGVPDILYCNIRIGQALQLKGKNKQALKHYKLAASFYDDGWETSTKGYSCMNGLLSHRVNNAILLSFALEKTNRIDDAIQVLSPHMANTETYGSKIHYRYIELCIKKYGLKVVKSEVQNSVNTLHITNKHLNSSNYDEVAISIFNTDIGMGNTGYNYPIDSFKPKEFIARQDFYELVK